MLSSWSNEDTLVQRAISGDAEAFGELYQHHRDAIHRYVVARIYDGADAEDITGQVFLKAWEALPGYQQRGVRFSSWLYQIARNLVIDYHRACKQTPSTLLSEHGEVASRQTPAVDQVIAAEESHVLASALARLPHEQRQVLFLRFVRGLDHAEVARILAKSQGASRVIQRRALVALHTMLGKALLLVFFIITLAGALLYASQRSAPGEPLYSLKRIGERAMLSVASSDAAKAQAHLSFAAARLDEMARLLATGRTAELSQSAQSYTADVAAAQVFLADERQLMEDRIAVATLLIETNSRQEAQLIALRDQAPTEAQAALDQALASARVAREQALKVTDGGVAPLFPSPSGVPLSTPTPTTTRAPTSTPRPSVTPTVQRVPMAAPDPTRLPQPAPSVLPVQAPTAPRAVEPPVEVQQTAAAIEEEAQQQAAAAEQTAAALEQAAQQQAAAAEQTASVIESQAQQTAAAVQQEAEQAAAAAEQTAAALEQAAQQTAAAVQEQAEQAIPSALPDAPGSSDILPPDAPELPDMPEPPDVDLPEIPNVP
jgi:RNA polymerase sigma-70 factor (ECF subfamily)